MSFNKNKDNSIRVKDKDEDTLHNLSKSSDIWKKHQDYGYLELAHYCRDKCPPKPTSINGVEASIYLEELILIATNEIISKHSHYGAIKWLWYLRRLPDSLFSGSYSSTITYDRALAEVITGNFHESEIIDNSASLRYPINDHVFRQICRYVGKVKFLSMLHILYRRIGKGFELNIKDPILNYKENTELESAIKMYDTRHDISFENQGSRIGLANLQTKKVRGEGTEFNSTAILFIKAIPQIEVPIHFYQGKELKEGIGIANYLPSLLEANEILNPLLIKFDNKNYVLRICDLLQFHLILPIILIKFPELIGRILQIGYFSINENLLREIFNQYINDVNNLLMQFSPHEFYAKSYDEWIIRVKDNKASAWPLKPSKFIRRIEGQIILDIVSSSHTLIQNIQLDRSPALGNARAKQFEFECQQLINNSPWKPSPYIQSLRGKPLKKDSVLLTDIDAIGENGKTLLIISCKSIIYDDEYDKGSYKVIKNIQSTIDDAVLHWSVVQKTLIECPVGSNYDFSYYEKIIGIVCTPFVAYSSNPFTYRDIGFLNLKACISSFELSNWLKTDSLLSLT